MPGRMEDGNNMLTHWTKKIIIEDGHTGSQLVHILQLVVKHFKVYYPVRHHLIQHVVSSVQRLGFTATATIEQKRLAADLCEVVIKWEAHRAKEEHGSSADHLEHTSSTVVTPVQIGIKRTSTDQTMLPDPKRSKPTTVIGIVGAAKQQQSHSQGGSDAGRPIDKQHCDAIVNYLLRLACAVNDAQAVTGTSPGEMLSRRYIQLFYSYKIISNLIIVAHFLSVTDAFLF